MSITRPIGLIHCALAHGGVWRRFVEELGPGYLPILIELPGHGEAPDWDHSRDYSDQALELALDTLPAQPVPLIGHSYGAALALRLAVERPSRVSSLVLIEPVFFAAAKGSWAFDKVVRDHDPFVRKLAEGSNAMAAKAFTSVWDNETPWADIPQKQKDYLMSRIPLVKAGDNHRRGRQPSGDRKDRRGHRRPDTGRGMDYGSRGRAHGADHASRCGRRCCQEPPCLARRLALHRQYHVPVQLAKIVPSPGATGVEILQAEAVRSRMVWSSSKLEMSLQRRSTPQSRNPATSIALRHTST